jgi:hypothetical protein
MDVAEALALVPPQIEVGRHGETLQVTARANAIFTSKLSLAIWQGKRILAERAVVSPDGYSIDRALAEMAREVTPQLERDHARKMKALGYR